MYRLYFLGGVWVRVGIWSFLVLFEAVVGCKEHQHVDSTPSRITSYDLCNLLLSTPRLWTVWRPCVCHLLTSLSQNKTKTKQKRVKERHKTQCTMPRKQAWQKAVHLLPGNEALLLLCRIKENITPAGDTLDPSEKIFPDTSSATWCPRHEGLGDNNLDLTNTPRKAADGLVMLAP